MADAQPTELPTFRTKTVELDPAEEEEVAVDITEQLEHMAEVQFDHAETKYANVVSFGPPEAGKSSLINNIDTLLIGRKSRLMDAGTGGVTCALRKMKLNLRGDRIEKKYGVKFPADWPFRFWDTPPLSTEKHGEISYILDGNLPDMFKSDGQGNITPHSQGFIRDPQFKDKAHVVVLCLPAKEACSDENMALIKEVIALTRVRGLRTLLVLTKIEEVDETLQDHAHLAYDSEKVKAVIDKVQICGIPEGDIYPLKNYFHETEQPTIQVEYLLTRFLEALTYCCEDYFRAETQIADSMRVPEYK